MSSRLDRLFVLLDTGSSAVTRKAAALQLGEVQKLHPHELYNLLSKVHQYLRSSSWETRIAAGQAIEAIIRNVPAWEPSGSSVKKEETEESISQMGRMKFEKFDINKVLSNGSCLLGSEGKEYEVDEEVQGVILKERLAKQRQMLNKRLGLDVAERLGLDTSDIFSNEDLASRCPTESRSKNGQAANQLNKKAISEIVQAEIAQLGPGLSSREINRAKRKAKLVAKQKSREAQELAAATANGNEAEEPEIKKRRTTNVLVEQPSQEDMVFMDNVPDNTFVWEDACEWPFESLCDQLCQDLFSSAWEVRHGAATALREIVRVHGSGAGKTVDIPNPQLLAANQMWLEDLALRLLCVLALDRFGDFISDQVVAPVRETCAQTMGAVLHLMEVDGVHGVMSVLLQLLRQKEWEARHGGLLGLKYLLAVRQDITSKLLPTVFLPIFCGLQDAIDDVSAVAASALVPICDALVRELPSEVPKVIALLWDSLLELDDLTASTNSIMALLASLLSYPAIDVKPSDEGLPLSQLVPRLWPFLGHASSSVRKATLQTLTALLAPKHSKQTCFTWLVPILPETLRHIFQRCILEHCTDILDQVSDVWHRLLKNAPLDALLIAACPHLGGWLCLAMQQSRLPIDPNLLIEAKHKIKEKLSGRTRNLCAFDCATQKGVTEKYYIGGAESLNECYQERDAYVVRARCMAGRLLGFLSSYVSQTLPDVIYPEDVESPVDLYAKLLLFHLKTKSAIQRFTISLVLTEWSKSDINCQCPVSVKKELLICLCEGIYYDEIAFAFARMQQDCKDFFVLMKRHYLNVESICLPGAILTMEQAVTTLTTGYQTLLGSAKPKPKVVEHLDERRRSVLTAVQQTAQEQNALNTTVQATVATAVVTLKYTPEKLNPIIKPLMDSIKKEENAQLQRLAAKSLTQLLELCINRTPCPNPKIIKNVCLFLCGDLNCTPVIKSQQLSLASSSVEFSEGSGNVGAEMPAMAMDTYKGIMMLHNQQKNAEKASLRRANSVSKTRALSISVDVPLEDPTDDEVQRSNELQRRGAQFAIMEVAQHFGSELADKLPKLWEALWGPLNSIIPENFVANDLIGNEESAQELVNCLQLLEIIGPSFHVDLHSHLTTKLPHLCCCLIHPYTAVRHMAARCIGMMSCVVTSDTMLMVMEKVLPMFDAIDCDTKRQGAIEALACIIERLQFDLVPYIVLLVVPVMGRMSDYDHFVRLMATSCFATLVRLMPLEGGFKDPPSLNPELLQRKRQERRFLEQLFDTKKLENYKVPIPIKAELRAYQQDGVSWLAFLNRYKLHGILCDDMGLGKTLQSICILAGDHFYRDQEYKNSKSADSIRLPSLVICPPTLTGHWVYEVEKFINKQYLQPLHYTGPPFERQRLRGKVKKYNLVIASYDIVRNDIDFFSAIKWNYCILDEGHVIKNGKTKLSKAIKQLVANHRLILSGTPIQNNVLELWSLFDFLMPGFLGTEKQFTARYSKPILLSRDAKSSSKEQEAGALAMESLHRQALPFLLRRMKEDVLQDLPPKIIQDYYCDLSSLQVQLYEDFAKSRARQSLEDSLSHEDTSGIQGTSHIFQALQYLRKVCNHPKLVLSPHHPEFERIQVHLKEQNSNLSDIQHAAKLPALKQLLLDCGIGVDMCQEMVVNQHRALVFCQLKSMLDILERDLFQSQMQKVAYLRLDGSIPAGQRHAVVHRFNTDPSIDVLLLTTQVGGLGINLTGADTVIFVEHDWNPMKDLQAMDRAHRIGQKKVVNVYRLITKGTLEEKIMGLQKFKLTIANTVISQENSSLQSMGTDQLLDLFTLDDQKKGSVSTPIEMHGARSSDRNSSGRGIKSVLDTLPDLWDDHQYETEYDLCNFLQSLTNN